MPNDDLGFQQDSTWHQAEMDEQRMLSEDPAYVEWLNSIASLKHTGE